jgi:dienelactone hydrolase
MATTGVSTLAVRAPAQIHIGLNCLRRGRGRAVYPSGRETGMRWDVEDRSDLVAVVSRRRLLGGAAAIAGGLAVGGSTGRAAASGPATRVRLSLPGPTGRYEIGTVSLHLVDQARQDPWSSTPHPREFMVTVWYPAHDSGRCRRAPWMSPGALAAYRPELETFLSSSPDTPPGQPPIDTQVSLDGVEFPITHGRQSAPVARPARGYPVVLFSPGYGSGRELGTTLVEDLASHGYVVVTISHTYEAGEVEFPGGRVELGRHEGEDLTRDAYTAVKIRREDARFVIDQLTALNRGRNPDAERRPLPLGLRGSMDTDRIGIFGHSLGGATAAQTIAHDSRVVAGINLDGSFVPDASIPIPPVTPEVIEAFDTALATFGALITRPFMVMGSIGQSPDAFGALTSKVYYNLRGWRRFVSLVGSTHGSYTDNEVMFHQLAAAGVIGPASSWVGTIPASRAVAAERDYIRAFFDLWLRDRDSHLLDGPSTRYPEANFYP